jgi:hypothetical protein
MTALAGGQNLVATDLSNGEQFCGAIPAEVCSRRDPSAWKNGGLLIGMGTIRYSDQ